MNDLLTALTFIYAVVDIGAAKTTIMEVKFMNAVEEKLTDLPCSRFSHLWNTYAMKIT